MPEAALKKRATRMKRQNRRKSVKRLKQRREDAAVLVMNLLNIEPNLDRDVITDMDCEYVENLLAGNANKVKRGLDYLLKVGLLSYGASVTISEAVGKKLSWNYI